MTDPVSQSPASSQLPVAGSAVPVRSACPTAVTLLRVYGEDAFNYLQSQVTADLRASNERWVRYTLWLDSRGYVQADSFILQESAESFLLFSYHTPADKLEAIVLTNVIADDVEVEQLGEKYCHWALWGQADFLPQALQVQAGCWGSVAAQSTAGSGSAEDSLPTLLFAGRNTGGQNYDLLLPAKTVLPDFVAALPQVSWAEREAQRIADGIAAIPMDIGPTDLPQEGADLAKVAVSTSKGCYLGQEVIARWHATSQVRSGLFRLRLLPGKSLAAANSATEATATAQPDSAAQPATTEQATTTAVCAATPGQEGSAAEPAPPALPAESTSPALPLRLYAESKPVGQLRSFAPQNGAGLALLRIHRLGDARRLGVQAGGEAVFEVLQPRQG